MEFCKECKSLMVPKQTGDKKVLVCRGCGREKKKVKVGEYKITEASSNKTGDVLVLEEDYKDNVEEQRRYMEDLYGDSDGEG